MGSKRTYTTAFTVLAWLCLWGCSSAPGPQPESPQSEVPRIEFKGAEKISEGTIRSDLENEIKRARERGLSEADTYDLAFEVKRLYKNRGYHFARTRYDYSPRKAVFHIKEGPQVLIKELDFTGNTVFPDSELAKLLSARRSGLLALQEKIYVESEVHALRTEVENVYLERGYREVEAGKPVTAFTKDRKKAIISIPLKEGPQYVLKSIVFERIPLLETGGVQKEIQHLTGSAYVPYLKLEVKSRTVQAYANYGFPDARVSVSETAAEEETKGEVINVSLRVSAEPGPKVRIREIVVQGNKETSSAFIESRLLLNEGDIYNGKLVRRSFGRLFKTGLFQSVELKLSEPEGAPGKPDREVSARTLVVKVVEAPSLEYFFEVGFGSYDLARGKAGVREKNLFGRGLRGRAEVLGCFRGTEGTLGLTAPWLFETDWTADLPVTFLYREEPSYTIQEEKLALRLSRPLSEKIEAGSSYRFSFSTVEKLEVETGKEEEPNLRVGALGPYLKLDTRDDQLTPTRGSRVSVFSELGAPALGGEISFYHGGLTASHYMEPIQGSVIASQIQTEWIVPFYNTQDIPIQERLFNGGENTVRSFQQSELGPEDPAGDPLGGEVKNLISLELRQRVFGQLSFAVFGDYGNVSGKAGKPFHDFRPAVGAGLRYTLPIGPVRLDVGFNPDKREEEDLYVIHFAVGLPF